MSPFKPLVIGLNLIALPLFAGPEYDRDWSSDRTPTFRCKKEKSEKTPEKVEEVREASEKYKDMPLIKERFRGE